MLLSIIIPVYNVERYLAECLDSVFNQDLLDCEVIAVDDGSTDRSGEILEYYKQKYNDLIVIHQPNKGLSGARNTGINYAKGDYLYFLDSDDFLLQGAIKTMLVKIDETKAELIGFNAIINNKAFIGIHLPDKILTGVEFFEKYFFNNGCAHPLINVWLYVYKAGFIKQNHLNFINGLYHEDIHFTNICLCIARSIIVFNIPILVYRYHRDGSISAKVKLKTLVDKSFICRNLDVFYKEHRFYNIFFYNELFHTYVFTIMQSVDNHYIKNKSKYFNNNDIEVMKKGIMNVFEFKLFILAVVNQTLMVKYYRNLLPNTVRRLLNIGLTLITYLVYGKRE